MIFSAYRKDDFADPVGFVAQLGAVLEKYPEWVVRYVTEPTTGIQRRQTFPPSIAEVVKACEEIYAGERFTKEWNARAQKQIEERQESQYWTPTKPAGPVITWGQAEEIMKGKKTKIYGAFDRDRQTTYRG